MAEFVKIDGDEITRRFTNVRPKGPEQAETMDEITARFVDLGVYITNVLPNSAGRELALAIQELEKTMFWVKKGYALNQ